jgi:transitional endoplasmic reticulum ATPase
VLEGYSNADLEALALLAAEFAERARTALTSALLKQAIDDFMPPQEIAMVRYMEMLAVSETSRRSLLPQRFRALSVQEVQTRLAEFRRQIDLCRSPYVSPVR